MKLSNSSLIAVYCSICFWIVFLLLIFTVDLKKTSQNEMQKISLLFNDEFSYKKIADSTDQSEQKESSNTIEKNAIKKEENHSFLDASAGDATVSAVQLSSVLSEINKKILQNHVYPERARRRNIEGVVFLRLMINLQGNLDFCEIIQSAGKEILDLSAIKLVKSIFPLDTRPLCPSEVTVSVSYELH
ncbi:MAG: energy transducer TonB [Treponemataceae bacterium]